MNLLFLAEATSRFAFLHALTPAFTVLGFFIIGFALLQNLFYLIQILLAALELRGNQLAETRIPTKWLLTSKATPGISMLVPAYNEAAGIVENIHSLLALHYPDFEVVVVNDGSKDNTAQRVIEAFRMEAVEVASPQSVPHKPVRGLYQSPHYPNLIFVDKENGGKADALNAGVNLARKPLFCCVDADSLLNADSLLRAARPFAEKPDQTIAVGGTIRIANSSLVKSGTLVEERIPRNILALFQYVEYFRAFMLARLAFSRLKGVAIISGAFGLFKRNAVIAVGGYSLDTVGEDMELVVKLHRFFCDQNSTFRITSIPDPVCWTEAPESLKVLRRQRTRWHRGMCETLWTHRRMLLKSRYRILGLLILPLFVIFDILGPIFEAIGFLMLFILSLLGLLSWAFFFAYFSLIVAFGVFLSVMSLVLAEISFFRSPKVHHMFALGLGAILENFGYRQLNSLWRIEGLYQFFRKQKSWGDMQRKGFTKV